MLADCAVGSRAAKFLKVLEQIRHEVSRGCEKLRRANSTYLGKAAYQYARENFPHDTVKHARGEYVRGNVHKNSIESFWALLKRGIVVVCPPKTQPSLR